MKGLFLNKGDSCLDKVAKKSAALSLLARGEGTEIMLQKIKSGKIIQIVPGDDVDCDLMEFYYILEGTVSYDKGDEKVFLSTGDYFYVHQLEEEVNFMSENDVTMLYVSTQPVFHMLSDQIKELTRISKIAEEKDMYTHDHEKRLHHYSLRIAKLLNIPSNKFEGLLFGALYHDIGKINVPDEILLKPGRLTEEEFEYIRKHPEDGKALVNSTYLKFIGDFIEQHHERLDGSGYPKGLKDEEISIEAKIIGVVDSYDAMTSDRPYRKGMTPKQAIEELKSLADIHYDRSVVDALEKILKDEDIL